MADIQIGANRYGKGNVRLLRVVKDSPKHEVHELKAQILLEGEFTEAFTKGLNHQILPTETQKNTLYYLSKTLPIDPIENWVVLVAKYFIDRYSHISAVNLDVDVLSWSRIVVNGREHNHAFQKSLSGTRTVSSRIGRDGSLKIVSGFKDLQVLKTTQAGFEGFIKDEFTTLPEVKDRVLATKIACTWNYYPAAIKQNLEYNKIYNSISTAVLETFAGNPDTGVYSASVQQTIYDIGVRVLKENSSIQQYSMALPNVHYYKVNFAEYQSTIPNNNEVFFTFDGAHGQIEATIERKPSARL